MESTHGDDLVSAAQDIADRCREAVGNGSGLPLSLSDTTGIRAAMTRMQTLLLQLEPTVLVERIAEHSQFLACLRWLGEFQVLAYLPPGVHDDDGLPMADVAELADVPEAQLCRIVRLMAMEGFLREPQPGFVAHTAASASFVQRPAQLDAVMFLAETAAPSALHMAEATRRQEAFAVDWAGKRTQRLWASFLGTVGGADDAEIIAQLDWGRIVVAQQGQGEGGPVVVVVDVGAPPRKAIFELAERHPRLRFVVQSAASVPTPVKPHHHVAVIQRAPGTPQTVNDAAVFLVRLPTTTTVPLRSCIESELRAHLHVLESNRSALLILTAPVLPEPGTVPTKAEHLARLRDLSLVQLVGDGNLTLQELVDLVHGVREGHSGLMVVKKLYAPNSAFVGLGIRSRLTSRDHWSNEEGDILVTLNT